MNRKIRFWVDWVILAVIALWALTLAVHSRRETAPDNIVRRSMLILSSPILKSTHSIAGRINSLFYSVLHGPASYNEIQEYNRQIRRLQIVVAHQNETVRRLQRLSRIETKSLQEDYRLVLAQVIGRGRDTYTEGLLISMGELDGLKIGLPVVHENATVVGYIREVNATDSYIQLLSDPNSLIACSIENTNESGVVRGLGPQADHLEFLPRVQTSTLSEGARLVTSGLTGSLFPGGLRIGEIMRIEPNDAGERVGQVRPGVHFASLEEVVVLLPRHGPIRPLNLHLDEGEDGLEPDAGAWEDGVTTGAIDIPVPEEIAPPAPATVPTPTPTPREIEQAAPPVATRMPRPATTIVTPLVPLTQPARTPPATQLQEGADLAPPPPAEGTAGATAATSPTVVPSYLQQMLSVPDRRRSEPAVGETVGSMRSSIQERGLVSNAGTDGVQPPVILLNDDARRPFSPEPDTGSPARYIFD